MKTDFIIMDEMAHMTDEDYEAVKKLMPEIPNATVYRKYSKWAKFKQWLWRYWPHLAFGLLMIFLWWYITHMAQVLLVGSDLIIKLSEGL